MNLGADRFPGTIESVDSICGFIRRISNQVGLSESTAMGLLLAVDELAANIVNHAYIEAGRTGDIEISATLEQDMLHVTIVDSGDDFDPAKKPPPPDLDAPLEERRIGGLGIFLALKQLDHFEHKRIDGRNFNILTISKNKKIDGDLSQNT